MNEHRFPLLISSIWTFLHRYYEKSSEIDPQDYIFFASHASPRLLINENTETDEAFVALEFPYSLRQDVDKNTHLNVQSLSVVCEELSHLFHYTDAAASNYSISVLDLETIAEIDRFLCFMHWNDFFPEQRIELSHENCMDLCDTLFSRRVFQAEDKGVYLDAESKAFYHIKKAFSHCWTKRWLDTSCFDTSARAYLLGRMTQLKGTQWAA
jgi:hypothetical protein